MLYTVTIYIVDLPKPERFKVRSETPTGALIAVLGFDWTVEERKGFLGARVDPYVKGQAI